MSVESKIKSSIVWSAVERFSAQGLQFIISIIIARLLLPSDYGLIAELSIFIGLAQNIVDSGFVSALIQKRNPRRIDYDTTFWFNVSAGVGAYVLLFVFAPSIARFYDSPELISVTRIFGLLPLITSLGLVARAQLMRRLKFRQLAFSGIGAVVISGTIGLYMAYSGFGVWALVAQTLTKYTSEALIMWGVTRWSPRLKFSGDSFRGLWHFSSKLLFGAMLHSLYENAYTMLLGYKYSKADAGLFNRSQTLAMFPALNFSSVIIKALYPIECKIQDDDSALGRLFVDSIRLGAFIVFPLMAILAATAEPFILVILKAQWLPAVGVLRILAVAYMLNPIMMLNTSILSVKGRTDYAFRAEVIKKIVGVTALLSLIWFGLEWVAYGFLFYSVADIVICSFFVHRVISIRLYDQFRAAMPIFLLTAAAAAAAYLVTLCPLSDLWRLTAAVGVGAVVYLGGAVAFKLRALRFIVRLAKGQNVVQE